jgi:hypothetical protein
VMTRSAEATALSTDAPDVETAREAIESGSRASNMAPADAAGATAAVVPEPGPASAPAATSPPASLAAQIAAGQSAQRPATVAPQQVAAAAEAALKAAH